MAGVEGVTVVTCLSMLIRLFAGGAYMGARTDRGAGLHTTTGIVLPAPIRHAAVLWAAMLMVCFTVFALAMSPVWAADPVVVAAEKPQPLDFARATSTPGDLVDQLVYVVGRLSAEAPKGAARVSLAATKGDYMLSTDVTLTKPLAKGAEALDTVLVTGRVSKDSSPKRLVLTGGACQRVCRLQGRLSDGDVAYQKAAWFSLPYGAVDAALAKSRGEFATLVSKAKMVALTSADGGYDFFIGTGKSDVMAIYTDPKGVLPSLLWLVSSDFAADTLRFDMGQKLAVKL